MHICELTLSLTRYLPNSSCTARHSYSKGWQQPIYTVDKMYVKDGPRNKWRPRFGHRERKDSETGEGWIRKLEIESARGTSQIRKLRSARFGHLSVKLLTMDQRHRSIEGVKEKRRDGAMDGNRRESAQIRGRMRKLCFKRNTVD